METLYEYLLDNYKENEPIFLADLQVDGMTRTNVRQQIKKLTDTGKVKRFDNGIYFLPKKTIFKSGSQLAPEKVLECKYLRDKDERCGYVSGLMFFNQMGLTTQVPMMYEVVSNKATNDYRETSLAKSRVIVRKPKVPVTEKNYKALQFLDMLKDVDVYRIQKIEEILARKAADFSSKTAIHTQRLFVAYGFDEVFGRSMITKQLGIKEAAVSRLITKLLKADIIEPVSGYGNGKYRFKSN